jgi:phosphatidylserine/phosphatidylglycerophosphate/cardiolipin synthase-like enzyme
MFSSTRLDGAGDVRIPPARPELALASTSELCAAIGHACEVALTAYRLEPGLVAAALERAAARGASVTVTLEGAPYDPGRPADSPPGNVAIAARLRAAGVAVRLSDPGGEPLHMKAALVDGRLYLDGRNFASDGLDLIVRCDEPEKLAGSPDVAFTKGKALCLEASLLAGARGAVDVESESFGPGIVTSALEAAVRRGDDVRVVVAARDLRGAEGARERLALARLAGLGARVRVGESDEKLAIAGDRAWIGSANATSARPGTIDWGVLTQDRALAEAARDRFERDWLASRPLRALTE